jgi:hypothetical protein
MKTISMLLAIVFGAITTTAFSQQIIYVRADAQGNQTGQNWQDAFANLQNALNQASYGDEIRVAAGLYHPTNDNNRDSSFHLKNGLRLRGGFAGQGTDPDMQDASVYHSVLSGDIGVPGDSTDNSYSVLTALGNMDENTLLEAFSIEDGAANSVNPNDLAGSPRKSGGGIYMRYGNYNHLRLSRCSFKRNWGVAYGSHVGMIFTQGVSNVRFEHCTFEDGIGTSTISFFGNSVDSICFFDCLFRCNKTSATLSITQFDHIKRVVVSNCTFQGNANTWRSEIYGENIAFHDCHIVDNENFWPQFVGEQVELFRNRFENNQEIYVGSNRPYWSPPSGQSIAIMRHCLFEGNKNLSLGLGNDCIFLQNSIFNGNESEHQIILDNAVSPAIKKSVVDKCLFSSNNSASLIGVVPYLEGFPYQYVNEWEIRQSLFIENEGSIFYSNLNESENHRFSTKWQYCTFIDNVPLKDSLFTDSIHAVFVFVTIDTVIFNSCVFDYTLEGSSFLLHDTLSHIELHNNLFVADSCTQVCQYGDDIWCSDSNLWGVSDVFADKVGGDYRLAICSPGINQGDTPLVTLLDLESDLGGNPRVEDGWPDVGAFERKLSLNGGIALGTYKCAEPATGSVEFAGSACPPFEYSWDNGQASGSTNENLSAGSYAFSITDAHGILFLDTVIIPAFAPMTFDSLLHHPSSAQASDGSISIVSLSGGVAPYAFQWSTGDTSAVLTGLTAGLYELTVTDALGCQTASAFKLQSETVEIQNLESEEFCLKLFPNLVRKGTSAQLFSNRRAERVFVLDALGKEVFRLEKKGEVLVLPPIFTIGNYWVLTKDAETGAWSKAVSLMVME